MRKRYVYADLLRTGICNMLFTWARAVLFARDHHCLMLAPNWVQIGRLGPWFRGDRDKRYYFGQLTNKGYVGGFRKWIALHGGADVKVVRGWGDFFDDIASESKFLSEALNAILAPRIAKAVESLPQRFIGVHVRRGDFARIGQAMPLEYYCRGIKKAREIVGEALPVLVFSDAPASELSPVLACGDVTVMPPAPALQDMLSLSKAAALVATNKSTFSGWASFLGQMPTIWAKEGLDGHEYIEKGVFI